MSHVVYMDMEIKKLAVSQIPCPDTDVSDVPISFEDWTSSRLSPYFHNEIALRSVHANMYHALRGGAI